MNKILFSGGGTLGSTTPLLAIQEKLDHSKHDFIWIGTRFGPEEKLIEDKQIKFYQIFSGKIRRYFSVKNLIDPFKALIGLFQSMYILIREKPDVCISAGGFISVPVHLSAWLLNIPTWVHQQDVQPGLSNKIMAKFANKVTVALEESQKHFSNPNTECIGNPVREGVFQGREEGAKRLLNLQLDKPVIMALGGGTGAEEVNELILGSIEDLDGFEIIHITGPMRDSREAKKIEENYSNYHSEEFLGGNMKHAYSAADFVVCRAGFSTLSELTALNIPAVLVPKEGHQQLNAKVFSDSKKFINFKEKNTTVDKLINKLQGQKTEEGSLTLRTTAKEKMNQIITNLINTA